MKVEEDSFQELKRELEEELASAPYHLPPNLWTLSWDSSLRDHLKNDPKAEKIGKISLKSSLKNGRL